MQAHLTDSYISRIKTPDSRVELKDTRIPGFIATARLQLELN